MQTNELTSFVRDKCNDHHSRALQRQSERHLLGDPRINDQDKAYNRGARDAYLVMYAKLTGRAMEELLGELQVEGRILQ